MSEVTVIQTVRDAIATKLDEIEGLTIYKSHPERGGGAVPYACLTMIDVRMYGGFPDTRQYVDLLIQVDVWAYTPDSCDIYVDKVIDKIYRSRSSFDFVDILLRSCRDMPSEAELWRKVLEFKVTTIVTKS